MIRRLVLDIPTDPRSVFQRDQNHRTGGYTVTRNGRPVIETTTKLEADDEIADLEAERRRNLPKAPAPAPVILTGEALRRAAKQAVEELFPA